MFQRDEEKLNIIQNKLSEGIRDIDTPLDDQELLEILHQSHKSGQFNPDLYNQLTTQISKNNQSLTIRNFSLIWLQAEQRLIQNRTNLQSEIEALKEEKDNYTKLKIENQEHEKLNANNIMQGSELNVKINTIKSIVNQNNQPANANFILGCEGQTAETGISDNPNIFLVDKTFKFKIKTGEEPLTITMVGATNLDNEPEGVIDIDLKELRDQNTFTHDINFYYEQNQMLPTVINVELLWIYSYVKLYSDSITQINNEIKDKEEEIENAEEYNNELYAPFPSIRRENVFNDHKRNEMKEVYNPHANQVVDKKFSRIPVDTNPTISKFLLFMVYFYVIIALATSFHRVVFLDLLMSLLLFSSLQLNLPMFIKAFANKIIFGLILAILLDVIWLVFYTLPWWRTGYEDGFSLLSLRRAMIVISYLIMLVRLLVLVAIFLSYGNLQTGKDEFESGEGGFIEQTHFNPHQSGNQDYPAF